jgi:hypothetical protein
LLTSVGGAQFLNSTVSQLNVSVSYAGLKILKLLLVCVVTVRALPRGAIKPP